MRGRNAGRVAPTNNSCRRWHFSVANGEYIGEGSKLRPEIDTNHQEMTMKTKTNVKAGWDKAPRPIRTGG